MKLNLKIENEELLIREIEEADAQKYYEWLNNEEILKLTESKSMSLDETRELILEWINDEDTFEFIIVEKKDNMLIGDITFRTVEPGVLDYAIMIGETQRRGKGYAKKASQMIFEELKKQLNVREFICDILLVNSASLRLVDRLGFKEIKRDEKQIFFKLKV